MLLCVLLKTEEMMSSDSIQVYGSYDDPSNDILICVYMHTYDNGGGRSKHFFLSCVYFI